RLVHWLTICPRKQFTTLDTHDGIGVVDVKDLLTEKEIEETREALYKQGANVKKIYSTEAYNNLDIYQINCTYYSALGDNDAAYLLARAIQCFVPGIPQVYYVGLLAGKNDIDLLEKTKEGRNINRHYYDKAEVSEEMKRPIVKDIFELLSFRNRSTAFDGEFSLKQLDDHQLMITWKQNETIACLKANLQTHQFEIYEREANEVTYQFVSSEVK
ncbi:MAG: sucrose phosphorylase, partial [Carnobacterium sp.]|uniref:sucrose phosphorylase n=1 Tax=Carnobacterium sp. TaxID=48221 RepID=UPI002FCC2915